MAAMRSNHRHDSGRALGAPIPSLLLACALTATSFAAGAPPIFAAEPTPATAITSGDARRVCARWLELARSSFGDTNREILEAHDLFANAGRTSSEVPHPLARVFNLAPEGWVVVAADRGAAPIVAYSTEGQLDLSSDEGMVALVRDRLKQQGQVLAERAATIAGSSNGEAVDPTPAWVDRAWEVVTTKQPASPSVIEEGGPLLETAWHQGEPFQDLCPMGTGGQSVVGCVATAGAQILRYYQWPPRGEGSKRYLWAGDQSCREVATPLELEADFSDPYDWANMPLTTSENEPPEVRAAVAELCYEVGAAVEMDYGYCGSSANPQNLSGALVEFFRYNPSVETISHLGYGRDRWFEMIRGEIDRRRPLFYTITAHSLVCDGYRRVDDLLFYHVNYGWGGSRNAWFALDEVPGNNDPWLEFMVRHITPADGVHRLQADGSGAFATLASAIENALDGETIELADGIYRGDGNRDLIIGDRNLVLRSAGGDPTKCVLDAGGSRADPHVLIAGLPLSPPGITIEGITFRGAWESGPTSKGAINCTSGHAVFRNCIFEENVAGETGGAVCISEARPEFENCLFRHNRPYGVECFQSAPTFRGCTFIDHDLSSMRVHESEVTLERCTFAFNRASEGDLHVHSLADLDATQCIFAFSGGQAVNARVGRVTLHCSVVYGNASGDWVGGLIGQEGVDGNTRLDPNFCGRDLELADFSVQEDSPCAPNAECGGIGAFGIGCRRPTTGAADDAASLVPILRFAPSPTHGPTRIDLMLASPGRASVSLYDAAGRRVRTLFDGMASAGVQGFEWNGRDDAGRMVASGVYLARLLAPGVERTERLLVVR